MRKGDKRRAQLLDAAMRLAEETDYKLITRAAIASFCGVTESLVSFHLGDMDTLRDTILREAIRLEKLSIVARGLLDMHPIAVEAPQELKDKVAESLS